MFSRDGLITRANIWLAWIWKLWALIFLRAFHPTTTKKAAHSLFIAKPSPKSRKITARARIYDSLTSRRFSRFGNCGDVGRFVGWIVNNASTFYSSFALTITARCFCSLWETPTISTFTRLAYRTQTFTSTSRFLVSSSDQTIGGGFFHVKGYQNNSRI